MIKSKSAVFVIMVLGIIICVTPLVSQKNQGKNLKVKIRKPTAPQLKPDLVVDTLEFNGRSVKVYIKNRGKITAKGSIRARLVMRIPKGWTSEKSILSQKGKIEDIIPTKTPMDRALVTFSHPGLGTTPLKHTKFDIYLDTQNRIAESNEQNNKYPHNGLIVRRPPKLRKLPIKK